MRAFVLCAALVAGAAATAAQQQPATLSLLGKPLYPPSLSSDDRQRAEQALAKAQATLGSRPDDADAQLARANATATLGRYAEALELFTRAIEMHPDDARLYLARGRNYLIVRKFDPALRDFRKISADHHDALCLAGYVQYVKGDFADAASTLGPCAPSPWAYLATRRAGHAAARPPAQADPLLDAYMAAADKLIAGRRDDARGLLKTILDKNEGDWTTLPYIAAEADYARLPRRAPKKTAKK